MRGQINRRYSRRRTRELSIVLILAVLVAARLLQNWLAPAEPEALQSGWFTVERVVDGDTLLLAGGARVRLQGIDTPETKKENHPIEPWGPEAAEYTAQFIAQADNRVQIEFGPERKDQYGRFLGFVYHGDRLLNEELVREGLARATTQYRFSPTLKRRLRQAEGEARATHRGIWSVGQVSNLSQ